MREKARRERKKEENPGKESLLWILPEAPPQRSAALCPERRNVGNPRKTSEKGLTMGERSARIAGLSRRRRERGQGKKKVEKTFGNPLDKRISL